jgi:hypothetical protein
MNYKLNSDMMGLLSKLSLLADQARNELEEVVETCEGQLDDRSESFQESERGQEIRDWIERVQELSQTIGEVGDLDMTDYESSRS